MNEAEIKNLADKLVPLMQILKITAVVATDVREALQPTVNQVAILLAEAVLATKEYAEGRGLSPDEALKVAMASLISVQGALTAATAQATKDA